MAKIVVIGSCNIDVTVECDKRPKAGETLFGNRLIVSPGGKGANQAVAAARLGAEVVMVGCVGDDVYGDMILKNLRENNVNTKYVKVLPNAASGTAHITLAEGDNSIIVLKAANDLVNAELIDEAFEAIQTADLVLLQHEIPFDAIAYAIDKCYAAQVPVLLNPAPVAPVAAAQLEKVTYLTPNEHEAAVLFNNAGTDDVLRRYAGKVIMTLGSKGVLYCENDLIINVPAFKVRALDTTGAGDTFNGAFAVARAEGKSMADSIRFANAAAALSVQKIGAQGGMPYLKEVEEIL